MILSVYFIIGFILAICYILSYNSRDGLIEGSALLLLCWPIILFEFLAFLISVPIMCVVILIIRILDNI